MPTIYTRPTTTMPVEEFFTQIRHQDKSQITFAVPVSGNKTTWDFTNLENTTKVYIELQKGQKHDIHLLIRDGMDVQVVNAYDSEFFGRVHLHRQNGTHSIAHGYVYPYNKNCDSFNCNEEFKTPSDTLTLNYDGEEYNDKFTSDKISCRHLAVDAIEARAAQEAGMPNWKDVREEKFRNRENLHKTFDSQNEFERKVMDGYFHDGYTGDVKYFGNILSGAIKELCKTHKIKHDQSKEFRFLVTTRDNKKNIGHCFGLSVKVKNQKDGNGKYRYIYKVKMYDPNISWNHLNYTATSLAELSKFDFHQATVNNYLIYDYLRLNYIDSDFSQKNGAFNRVSKSRKQKYSTLSAISRTDGTGRFNVVHRGVLEIFNYFGFKKTVK